MCVMNTPGSDRAMAYNRGENVKTVQKERKRIKRVRGSDIRQIVLKDVSMVERRRIEEKVSPTIPNVVKPPAFSMKLLRYSCTFRPTPGMRLLKRISCA